MSKKTNDGDIILVDADIINHFFTAQEVMKLGSIFPGRFRMLDEIFYELVKKPGYRTQITSLVEGFKYVTLLESPDELEITVEYAKLRKAGKGKGESACMATAKHRGYTIASSNLRDIEPYCGDNKIKYYTTMDLLYECHKKGVMSDQECDQFLFACISAGHRFPCEKMCEYFEMIKNGHRSELYGESQNK